MSSCVSEPAALGANGLRATAVNGTRIEDPAVTRARLVPLLERYGITRVANVTGLDRLGLPVWMAIRPNSRSLSVSQGKGVTYDAAWVSGVMESIELWHAERAATSVRLSSEAELPAGARVVDVDRLPTRPGSPLNRHHRMLWAEGVELFSGAPIFVPYALVHVNSVPPFPPGDECFFVTSNGLASGSAPVEAMLHALCELVERDAVSRWRQGGEGSGMRSIDLSTVDSPLPRELLALCRRMDFDVIACDATSPVGLPTIVCVLLDRTESSDTLRGAAMGFGCHLRRDIAFIRALTEAAQSRLTLIAGSRDDLDRQDYEARRRHRDGIEAYRHLLRGRHDVDFGALPDYHDERYDAQLEAILQRLAASGMTQAAVVELAPEAEGLSVIRAIVPGLRGPDHAH
jgi:ribosomal protein S12 methylthiotransferase accessory factor